MVIDGLKGSTQYSIEVAAVGAGETGVFSDAVTAEATAAAGESEWLGIMTLMVCTALSIYYGNLPT